jgi:hypothetical protein
MLPAVVGVDAGYVSAGCMLAKFFSDKKYRSQTTRANVSSSPAPTPTNGHKPARRHAKWLLDLKNQNT